MEKEESVEEIEKQLMINFYQVKQLALKYLIEKKFIKEKEEVNIKNVIRYKKDVELTKKESEGKKKNGFKLYVVEWENTNPKIKGSLTELEFLVEEDENGNIVNIHTIEELVKDYEKDSFKNIKDVVDETQENEKKPQLEQDEELRKDSLEEIEEKKKEEKKENDEAEEKKQTKEESNNDLTGKKPENVMQTIDVDNTYVDDWTTVSRAFDLPPEVRYLAIGSPMQKDDHIISSNMTMYMLDNKGNIIENVRGKTIRDYFEIDDATGHNPMYDDNTKLELDGDYAEKNIGQTMRRFKSRENPDLYLSIEQKEVGGYHEVYVGGKTLDGNDPVEIQLETRNVEIQTDLDKQKIISTYSGEYNKDEMDKEADLHKEHRDDEEKIELENVDGDEQTRVACDNPFVPDTEITWEQLSKSLGGKDIEELGEDFFKQYNGKNGQEVVLKMQFEYKEKEAIVQEDEEKEIEEYEGRVPWDTTKH